MAVTDLNAKKKKESKKRLINQGVLAATAQRAIVSIT